MKAEIKYGGISLIPENEFETTIFQFISQLKFNGYFFHETTDEPYFYFSIQREQKEKK